MKKPKAECGRGGKEQALWAPCWPADILSAASRGNGTGEAEGSRGKWEAECELRVVFKEESSKEGSRGRRTLKPQARGSKVAAGCWGRRCGQQGLRSW